MNSLLFWLTVNIGLVSMMWVPYILNAFAVNGIFGQMGYAAGGQLADWAVRAKKAHLNAVENLILFLPLMLIALFLFYPHQESEHWLQLTQVCKIYFYVRLIHYLSYLFKIPYVRTLAFVGGFGVQFYLVIFIIQQLSA